MIRQVFVCSVGALRLVKHRFRDRKLFEVLTKKPIVAGEEEQKINPRSRSAKLRFARRIT